VSITPKTLAWLRQSAKFEGAVTAHVLLLLERVEALEEKNRLDMEAWASMRRASCDYQRRLLILEAAQQQPTPVATDKEQPLPSHIAITYQPKSVYQPLRPAQPPAAQPTPPPAPAGGLVVTGGTGATSRPAQPAPPVAPAGGLVERVGGAMERDYVIADIKGTWDAQARAAIREVAAWMREHETGFNAVRLLEREADR